MKLFFFFTNPHGLVSYVTAHKLVSLLCVGIVVKHSVHRGAGLHFPLAIFELSQLVFAISLSL